MSATLFVEGGGDNRARQSLLKQGFASLLRSCGLGDRLPLIVPCGGRHVAFADFRRALSQARDGDWVGLLVDSEAVVAKSSTPWQHLLAHDQWQRPPGADDDQALLMVTCMESWIAADRKALAAHYGAALQLSALPALGSLERQSPKTLEARLVRATRDCPAEYAKGKQSFALLAKLNPTTLAQHLPAFQRFQLILDEHLPRAR